MKTGYSPKKNHRPHSASNKGDLSSLSTEQVFHRMKSRRNQRRISMRRSKKSVAKIDEEQMLNALDFKSDHVIHRGKQKGLSSQDSPNGAKFNSHAVHEKAIKNKTLAQWFSGEAGSQRWQGFKSKLLSDASMEHDIIGDVSKRLGAMEDLEGISNDELSFNSHHLPESRPNSALLPTTGSNKKVSFVSAGSAYGLPRLSDQMYRAASQTTPPSVSLNQIKEQRPSALDAGADAWKRWFQRHREAFRSLSLKMQVRLHEQSAKAHDADEWGTRKPDRLTTQTVVRLLGDLSDAPGEMGQLQKMLNREILRCIFYDFRDGDYDGPGPMRLRRTFYELVVFLEKRLKRMKARVRFFLHETETRQKNLRRTMKLAVFSAWREHTRLFGYAGIQRRMRVPRLRIWFSSWVRNLAELRHQQRVQGLLERLTYSVHVPTVLDDCPMLQNVCLKLDDEGKDPSQETIAGICQFFEHVLERIRHEQTRLLRMRILDEQQEQLRNTRAGKKPKPSPKKSPPRPKTWQNASQLWTVKELLNSKSGMILGPSKKSRAVQTIEVPPPEPPPAPPPTPTTDANVQTDFIEDKKKEEDAPPPPFTVLLQQILRHQPIEIFPGDHSDQTKATKPQEAPTLDSWRTFVLCCDILGRKQAHDAECDAMAAKRTPLPKFLGRYFLEASANQREHAASLLATFTASVASAAKINAGVDHEMAPARVVYWFGVLARLVDKERYCAPMTDFLCGILGASVSGGNTLSNHAGKSGGVRQPGSTLFRVMVRNGVIGVHTACQAGRRCLIEWVGRQRWLTVEHQLRKRVCTEGIMRGSAIGVCEWVDVMLSAWEREYQRRMETFKLELDVPSKPPESTRNDGGSKSKLKRQATSHDGADRKLWMDLVAMVAPDVPIHTLEHFCSDLHTELYDQTMVLGTVEKLASLVPWIRRQSAAVAAVSQPSPRDSLMQTFLSYSNYGQRLGRPYDSEKKDEDHVCTMHLHRLMHFLADHDLLGKHTDVEVSRWVYECGPQKIKFGSKTMVLAVDWPAFLACLTQVAKSRGWSLDDLCEYLYAESGPRPLRTRTFSELEGVINGTFERLDQMGDGTVDAATLTTALQASGCIGDDLPTRSVIKLFEAEQEMSFTEVVEVLQRVAHWAGVQREEAIELLVEHFAFYNSLLLPQESVSKTASTETGESEGSAPDNQKSGNSLGSPAAQPNQSFGSPAPFQKLDRKTLEKMSSEERCQALGQQCRTSRLAMACRMEEYRAVSRFIKKYKDAVNQGSGNNFTPLHECMSSSTWASSRCAALLLSNGADATASDSNGNTVLHMAYLAGNARMAAQLIESAGASIEAVTNMAGRLPQDLCADSDFPKLVHEMVRAREKVRTALQGKRNQVTQLQQQVLSASETSSDAISEADVAAMLLEVAPFKDKTADQSGLQYITYAALMEEVFSDDLGSALLQYLEIEPSSTERWIGTDEIAKTFWQLRQGLRNKSLKAQKELLILDRYQKMSTNQAGKTRMKIACQRGDAEAVKYFLAQGDDPDEKDKNYSTPLMHAAWSGRVQVARVLLGAGAQMNTANLLKNTALHFSFEKNHTELASLLVGCGAKSIFKNIAQKTAQQLNMKAHKAIKRKFTAAVVSRGFEPQFAQVRAKIVAGFTGANPEADSLQMVSELVFDKLPLLLRAERLALLQVDMFFQKLFAEHSALLAAWQRTLHNSPLSVPTSLIDRLQLQEIITQCVSTLTE